MMKPRTRWVMLVTLVSLLSVAPSAEARVWTDRSGRTIEADFVRLDGANVIVSRQGKEISIPLEKLSDEDQQYAKTAKPGEATGGGGDNPFESGSSSNSGGSKPADGGDSENDRERSGKYPLRDWRDRLGNRSRARFVSVVGQDVVLEKNNGNRINVPFHTLIENDQEYVERELKKAGTAHLTPSRTPPQNNNVGGGPGQPPAGGYAPGGGVAGPPVKGLGPPAAGFSSPPSGLPPSSSPPGFSSPPGGIGPGGGYGSASPPGNFGKPVPGYSTPPVAGPGASSPGMETPPGGYSSPPSGSPPGGYSSPPSGAPPGGFGPPGGQPLAPPMMAPPSSGPAPGGYTPPGSFSAHPSAGPGFAPPSGGPPFRAPFETPSGPGFNGPSLKEVFTCSNCNKQLPDNIKAGDKCPHCRAFLAYEQGADGKKTYASGGRLATFFIFGGGGFTAIAVVIGVIIRIIISATRD